MKYSVKIEGMGCGHCVKAIESALSGIKGITNLKVEIGSAQFDSENADMNAVKAAIEDAGYSVAE